MMSWPTVALLVALAAFLAIVAFVFLVPAQRWRKDARIPLDDCNPVESKPTTPMKDDTAPRKDDTHG